MKTIALGALPLSGGGTVLLAHALRGCAPGETVDVTGTSEALGVDLRAWCRTQGHAFAEPGRVTLGPAHGARVRTAEATGPAVVDRAPAHWGLAPRGARVEPGGPDFWFPIDGKDQVWADEVGRFYAQAAAAQWDPAKAIDWTQPVALAPDLEDAVVQVMTYLIENETAALLVPAAFVGRVHPHFHEVQQLLAVQAADEARHIEVFTRRARLCRTELGLSTVGGRASLKTLLDEPDFPLASFLLSVLGEGSFLSLLAFLRDHGPDPITRDVARLAGQDEARHVAFGLAHLERHAAHDPGLRDRLAAAIAARHDALASTAGLNDEVFDALVFLAAKSWSPDAIARGHAAVQALISDMDFGRRKRLERLGFPPDRAAALSSLHTRNFM